MNIFAPGAVPGGPELLIILFVVLVVFVIPALLLGIVFLIVRRRQRRIDELENRVTELEGDESDRSVDRRE